MAKTLVIVESPTKARTLRGFLAGRDVDVQASMGHVRDLPESSLGVDVEHKFKPNYVVTTSGRKTMAALKKAAAKAEHIYLATDPDREGEAISWHLLECLKTHTKADFHRVTFHEITRTAIQHAFDNPEQLDIPRVDAQQARRVLDRIVGYKVSPLLWRSIRKGTSAGRVQSVALKLVCDREREIQAFKPQEYWNMAALFLPEAGTETFQAKLAKLDGAKPVIGDADTANALASELESADYRVAAVNRKPKKRNASPPFITSTLQQAASSSLRISTRRTMRLAQELYEGIELGSEGPVGLITYMRTDSVAVAKEAQEAARSFVGTTYGPDYVPAKPNNYKSRQSAQAAHEAIRPTDVTNTPDKMAKFLAPDQAKLYKLIWSRFVASQMAPARLEENSIDVEALGGSLTHTYMFRTVATSVVFPGFLRIYNVSEPDAEVEPNQPIKLPKLSTGTPCELKELSKSQHFTEPPRRFSEATLVRELEQNGVGRPSTYAAIVNTIQQREYVTKQKGRLVPEELGFSVNDYLASHLSDLFQVEFTAKMEETLDDIERGNVVWTDMLEHFYSDFGGWLTEAGSVGAPESDVVRALMAAVPDTVKWDAPVKRGRRTYDDGKFFVSLGEQMDKGKSLSDRQWQALLTLLCRYADQLPSLKNIAEELGLGDQLDAVAAELEKRRKDAEAQSKQSPAHRELLGLLANVTFEPPVTRGKRVYDDAKFHASLSEQVESGKALSKAQVNALHRLVLKYRGQFADFEQIAEKHGLNTELPDTASGQQVDALLELLPQISKWDDPVKRRGRVYDDKEFADSISRQYEVKKSLSPRQLAALQKLVGRYHAQIEGYAAKAAKLGLPMPAAPAKPVENVACPECGKPVVERRGRKGPFYGCTGYPKCKFTADSLDKLAKQAE